MNKIYNGNLQYKIVIIETEILQIYVYLSVIVSTFVFT